jgi:type II secretion system protein G
MITSPANNFGFTLIELLVVISIIGMLSSIVLASLNSARDQAKATKVVSNLEEIQKALEAHKTDRGKYPTVDDGWSIYGGGYSGEFINKLRNRGYLSSDPNIPNFTSYTEVYSYDLKGYDDSSGKNYFDCDGESPVSEEKYVIGFISGMDSSLLPSDIKRFDFYGSSSPCITNFGG